MLPCTSALTQPGGEAPGPQGVRNENTESIRRTSNAAERDAPAAGCQRNAPPARVATVGPTCERKAFQAATDRFEALSTRRAETIQRVEGYPVDEPTQYVSNLEGDLRRLREVADEAQRVPVPTCLLNAREIYVRAFEQTLADHMGELVHE